MVKTKINETTHIINIAKGIENHSLMTMSEVINDVLDNQVKIVTLSGPVSYTHLTLPTIA